MTDSVAYFDIWKDVVAALSIRIGEINGETGSAVLHMVPQPARTVVIEKSGQPLAQASINLNGDAIEIKRVSSNPKSPVDETPEVIEVVVKNGTVRYVHDDLDSTADPRAVATMILGAAA
jgi:hypothetical protein